MGDAFSNIKAPSKAANIHQQVTKNQTNTVGVYKNAQNAANKKKTRIVGVTASRLGIGAKDDEDFAAPQKRIKQAPIHSQNTAKAIERYQKQIFQDLDSLDEDEPDNKMHVRSTHTGAMPKNRGFEEDNLDLINGNVPTNKLGNLKQEFPTLGTGIIPPQNNIKPIVIKGGLAIDKTKKKEKVLKQPSGKNQTNSSKKPTPNEEEFPGLITGPTPVTYKAPVVQKKNVVHTSTIKQ